VGRYRLNCRSNRCSRSRSRLPRCCLR
jgi:hypothetical protein